MTSYRGKTVLITGASSGIGASFARAFAAKGAHLVLAARSQDKLQALAYELSQLHGSTATVVPVDLTAPDGPETLAAQRRRRRDRPRDRIPARGDRTPGLRRCAHGRPGAALRQRARRRAGGVMPTITINGVRHHYVEQGRGPERVVFAHGVLMHSGSFSAQLAHLSPAYRCIAFDWRGHGQSEAPRSGYDVDGSLTRDALELIRQLGGGPVHGKLVLVTTP